MDSLIFFAVAFIAGAINSVAGGGTFLTFPVLLVSGMPAIAANATSTAALWPGSISAAWGYRSALAVEGRLLKRMMLISVLGGACGAWLLLSTPEKVFRDLVPWLLLTASLIFTFGKRGFALFSARLRQGFAEEPAVIAAAHASRASYGLQFIIAVYGGYFGAGIGILMLAMLQLMGLNHIHRMNALKSLLGSCINAVAVSLFVIKGLIIWPVALVMLCGGVAGGYFGARLALLLPPAKIRLGVSMIGFAMTAYFFWKG